MPIPTIRPVTIANRKIKALLYGPPGAGKTTLAATAVLHEAMRDVLILSIDRGESSVASLGSFQCVEIRDTKDLEATLEALVHRATGFESVRTIIADGISELQTIEIEGITRGLVQEGKRSSIDEVEIQDYGASGRKIARILRYFRDSNCHLIATAWDKRIYAKRGQDARKVTKEEQAPIKVGPAMTDALQTQLAGYMDFVWYVGASETGQRMMLTQPTGPYVAKTRGLQFAKALGATVTLRDPSTPDSSGHDMATIFDLLLRSEANPNS